MAKQKKNMLIEKACYYKLAFNKSDLNSFSRCNNFLKVQEMSNYQTAGGK